MIRVCLNGHVFSQWQKRETEKDEKDQSSEDVKVI